VGSNDEFGPDTETIRAWLAKRATYAKDARVVGAPRGTLTAEVPTYTPRVPEATEPAEPTGTDEPHDVVDETPAPPTAPTSRPTAAWPDTRDAGRSVLDALGDETPSRNAPAGPGSPGADSTAAGRSVVDALRADDPPRAKARPDRADKQRSGSEKSGNEKSGKQKGDQPVERPAPTGRASKSVRVSAPAGRTKYQASDRPAPHYEAPTTQPVRRGRWTEPEENLNSVEATTDVTFPVRKGARRVLAWVLLASALATGAASYLASLDRTPAMIVIASVLGVLTLTVWAVRASMVTTEITIRRGKLTVTRAGHSEMVEISGNHTTIAIIGEPGHRRWTVLFERPGLPLVVVNESMVDAHWFTSALYRLRPDLRPGYDASDSYADAAR
jgi:hypothetical protein